MKWITLGLISLTVIMFGLVYRKDQRQDYCKLACEDMRACSFLVPPNCEGNCERGHRLIDLPASCTLLKQAIDKAGYLF